jgi:hypothetical protein
VAAGPASSILTDVHPYPITLSEIRSRRNRRALSQNGRGTSYESSQCDDDIIRHQNSRPRVLEELSSTKLTNPSQRNPLASHPQPVDAHHQGQTRLIKTRPRSTNQRPPPQRLRHLCGPTKELWIITQSTHSRASRPQLRRNCQFLQLPALAHAAARGGRRLGGGKDAGSDRCAGGRGWMESVEGVGEKGGLVHDA